MPDQTTITKIFANARKGDYSVFRDISGAELSKLAKIQDNDETFLWLAIQHRKWQLAYRLVLCGADIGFTKTIGKYRGSSILSETACLLQAAEVESGPSSPEREQDTRDLRYLLDAIELLVAARGHELTAIEKFDMSKSDVAQRFEALMQKISTLFPTEPKTNYLVKMPLAVQFHISRFILPEWSQINKGELSCVYKELNKRKLGLHI